jgi:hypothetical protein
LRIERYEMRKAEFGMRPEPRRVQGYALNPM